MIKKILSKLSLVIVFLLWTLSILFAALGTIRQPTRLNIFVLVSLMLGSTWIIYTFFSLKKEKRLDDERIKQDRIRQEGFFKELEKMAGKEVADQLR